MKNIPVITVDGPSGVGKGTTASLLSNHLAWHLLDSGAIYRALALKVLKTETDISEIEVLVDLAKNLQLSFKTTIGEPTSVYLDGKCVNQELRQESCGNIASIIAAIPEVRAALLQRQKDYRQAPGLVADGRDMGTVVFQDAQIKFYLTASASERAKRRQKQLKNKGVNVNIRDLEKEIAARDCRDSNRKVSPLVPADDAIIIDTSNLSIDEVFQYCINIIAKTGL
ncbi:MAG TPA: (d)CMP kinase, partial [Oceanospirillales bacterium]|nr:(d)CMP kinase [Oceanospirillales bacterium]